MNLRLKPLITIGPRIVVSVNVHIYRLQISLRGPIIEAPRKPEDDMVIDIEELKRSVNMLIFAGILYVQTYSGLNQNDPNTFTGIRTTPGNLVHRIWDALVAAGVPDHLLYRVRLWETEEKYVEITHQERETYDGFE